MANLSIPDQLAASSSMASTSCSHYHIFINHRGPDVKNTFASYLYRRLISMGWRAFLDREELELGYQVFSQIEHAIRGASVHIAIFSPGYAQSPWCLQELVLMKNSGRTILPVFYKVDPSVVRHKYAEGLRFLQEKKSHDLETGEQKQRYDFNTIQKWRKALSDVADLKGFVLR
jgi:secreted Zn-dependent insulinase-like peptidase